MKTEEDDEDLSMEDEANVGSGAMSALKGVFTNVRSWMQPYRRGKQPQAWLEILQPTKANNDTVS